jgi:hypothetical protein
MNDFTGAGYSIFQCRDKISSKSTEFEWIRLRLLPIFLTFMCPVNTKHGLSS